MYLDHYSLTKRPFSISPDPRFLWLGEKHAEALATLKYGILDNKGFLLLTGEIGTGKTVLIKSLVKQLNAEVTLVTILDPRLELMDFFNILASELEMGRRFDSKGDFLIHFKRFLIEQHDQNKKVLLIVDEAQRLNHELMDEIRVLSNIEFDYKKLINIFFVGQSEFKAMLLEEKNRPLRQRITYNYHLEPLTEQETAAFIEHRLKVAGATKAIFSAEALREIYFFSQGIPRLINIICDHGLVTGYSTNLKLINVDIIRECANELQISGDIDVRPSPTPSVSAYDPPDEQPNLLIPLNQLQSSENRPIKKLAVITSIAVLLIGAAVAIFWGPRFKPSAEAEMQKNEDVRINDKSKNDPKLSANYMNSLAVTNNTQPAMTDEADSQPTKDIINNDAAVGSSEIETIGSKTNAGDADTITEVDLPEENNLKFESLTNSTATRPAANEVDRLSPAPGNLHTITTSEQNFTVHFDTDSSQLSSQAVETLNKIVELILHHADSETTIEGYTDSYGDYNLNQKLSSYRADIVKRYLVSRGIADSRIKAVGLGPANPIADNMTREGRRKNRRVEIKVNVKPIGNFSLNG